ncbi:hypothetical protein GCM10025869_22350 [Homoserinibacter gongjuensis]|uniref:Uncharacterized protein n=1 Tax=Homoserinibacter gongjuensis TaxID=1162968 RepID=A0ABQ6JTS8_9MICO|nr:hypothetical protein GCM10025869_22350 [Homoserinibacter gongjuensis]
MGAATAGGDVDPDRAIASALDLAARGLTEDGEVGLEQLGVLAGDATETVEGGVDLFVVVPNPGDVDGGLDELDREREHDGAAALHVDRAAPPQRRTLVDEPGGQVRVDRNGVDVTGDHDPLGPAERRAGDHGIPVARHLEVRLGAHDRLDRIGEFALCARDGCDVDELPRELGGRGGQVESAHDVHPTEAARRARRSR